MARRPRVEPGPIWPAWFYGPTEGEQGVFHKQDDVPQGWSRKRGEPDPIFERPATQVLNKEELWAKLAELGVDTVPTWGNAQMKKVIDDISTPR